MARARDSRLYLVLSKVCRNSFVQREPEATRRDPRGGARYGRKHTDGVTFHCFRHTMARLALNHGRPESTVQRMGNWESRVMVQRYAHLADEELRKAAAKLADLVGIRDAKKPVQKKKKAGRTGSD